MSIDLVPLGSLRIQMRPPIVLGQTPKGNRMIFEFTDVSFEGDRLRAELKGTAAADWALVGSDGTCALDVRYTLETDDGALVFMTYTGRVDLSGDPGAPIYSAPVFETADDRYMWLNRVQAIAKGQLSPEMVLSMEVVEVR